MATLSGRTPASSFQELLKVRNASGVDGTLRIVEDGAGNATPLSISASQLALGGLAWPTTGAETGKVLSVNSSSQLEWVTPSSGATEEVVSATSFTYNPDTTMATMTETIGSDTRNTVYSYTEGKLTTTVITYKGSTRTETYTYDTEGKVESIAVVIS